MGRYEFINRTSLTQAPATSLEHSAQTTLFSCLKYVKKKVLIQLSKLFLLLNKEKRALFSLSFF